MTQHYHQSSVLIRLTKHDSVSVMVLEMLARARHAIYSKRFPHCAFADDYASARAALARLIARPEPISQGPAFVAENVNPQAAPASLEDAYRHLKGRR